MKKKIYIICRPGSADLFAAIEAEITGKAKPIRIRAGGHDVTASMPRTAAALQEQRDQKGKGDKP